MRKTKSSSAQPSTCCCSCCGTCRHYTLQFGRARAGTRPSSRIRTPYIYPQSLSRHTQSYISTHSSPITRPDVAQDLMDEARRRRPTRLVTGQRRAHARPGLLGPATCERHTTPHDDGPAADAGADACTAALAAGWTAAAAAAAEAAAGRTVPSGTAPEERKEQARLDRECRLRRARCRCKRYVRVIASLGRRLAVAALRLGMASATMKSFRPPLSGCALTEAETCAGEARARVE